MLDDLKILAIAILGMAAAGALVIAGVIYPLTAWECSNYSEVTSRPTRTVGLTCYVKDGEWYAWEEYKVRFAPKGQQ